MFVALQCHSLLYCTMDDTRFVSPATIILSGTTSSGKSTWIERFLQQNMFDVKPDKIYYCYGVYQKKFEDMPHVNFIHGLPDSFTQFHGSRHNLIIIDDLQDEVANSKAVEQLFTRESHHRNLSVVYINQNLFYQGKHSRTIALNTHYTILFRNPRANSQLRILRSQTGLKHLDEAYNDVMKHNRFGYLVIDLSPYSKTEYKLRTQIFPHEDLIIYE